MKLQVVMLDRHRTEMAIMHENSCVPYGRRLVSIELTEEQVAALAPQSVGTSQGKEQFEQIGDVWLEEVVHQ
jgi:hypothetical protein